MLQALLMAACAVDGAHLVCTTTSTAGKEVTLTFDVAELEADPNHAFEGKLCANPARQLTEAKLWMSEHGHGSARTRLAADGNCTKVTRMVFTMSGEWEIRLKFSDDDTGVLHVAIP